MSGQSLVKSPYLKVSLVRGNPLIAGKSRSVKYCTAIISEIICILHAYARDVYSRTQVCHTAGCNCSHVFAFLQTSDENMLPNCKHQHIHPVQRTCVGWQLGNRAGKQTLHGLFTSLTFPGYNAINTNQLKYVRHVLFSYISPFGNHHPSSLALSHKVEPHGSESHGSMRQRCKPKQRQL